MLQNVKSERIQYLEDRALNQISNIHALLHDFMKTYFSKAIHLSIYPSILVPGP